jgi:cytochrome c
MDSYEINKILGAILGTCLVLLTLNITAGAMFSPKNPAKPGYEIAVKQEQPEDHGAPPAKAEPIEALLATASAERGATTAKQCQACHTFEKGGPNRVGPNLWGIVGRPRASHAGFNYSAAMKAKGGSWTIDDLNHFVTNPKGFDPGTAFAQDGSEPDTPRHDGLSEISEVK